MYTSSEEQWISEKIIQHSLESGLKYILLKRFYHMIIIMKFINHKWFYNVTKQCKGHHGFYIDCHCYRFLFAREVLEAENLKKSVCFYWFYNELLIFWNFKIILVSFFYISTVQSSVLVVDQKYLSVANSHSALWYGNWHKFMRHDLIS